MRLSIGAGALAMWVNGVAVASVTIVALEPIIGDVSFAWGVNNVGQVVGSSSQSASPQSRAATRWESGSAEPVVGLVWVDISEAYGINDSNQVVGGVTWSSTLPYLQDQSFHYLSGSGFALSINNSGVVIGVNDDFGGNLPAMWEGSYLTLLPIPGCDSGDARAINDSNVIVGNCSDGSQSHALRWFDDQVTDLGSLGGDDSLALSINNAGRIVGASKNLSGNYEAFIHDGARMIGAGTFGYDASSFWAINNVNQIIGYAWEVSDDPPPPLPEFHAMIYQDGHMTRLMDLLPPTSGWTYLEPYDINDHAQIAGVGQYYGQTRAFLMSIHAGDVNGDSIVGIDDLVAVIHAWGDCPFQQQPCPADLFPLEGNHVVDIDDLLQVIGNWD